MPPRSGSKTPFANAESSSLYSDPRPFIGIIETTEQAMRLVYAAKQGAIPRIIRRLTAEERKEMISSGAVFVFGAEESGMKRWTDGRLWSPSRVTGNFLVYKELAARVDGPRTFDRFEEWILSDGTTYSDAQNRQGRHRNTRDTSPSAGITFDQGLKEDGLIKKTITVKIHNLDFHLISYYTQVEIDAGSLSPLSSRLDIMGLNLPLDSFIFADFRIPPKLVVGDDGVSRIICEPEPREMIDGPSGTVREVANELREPPDSRDYEIPQSDIVPNIDPSYSLIVNQGSSVVGSTTTNTGSHAQGDTWQEHNDSESARRELQDNNWSSTSTSKSADIKQGQHYAGWEGSAADYPSISSNQSPSKPPPESYMPYQHHAYYQSPSTNPSLYISPSDFENQGRFSYHQLLGSGQNLGMSGMDDYGNASGSAPVYGSREANPLGTSFGQRPHWFANDSNSGNLNLYSPTPTSHIPPLHPTVTGDFIDPAVSPTNVHHTRHPQHSVSGNQLPQLDADHETAFYGIDSRQKGQEAYQPSQGGA